MVREGDEQAAHLLYDRYARRVLGLVEARLGDRLRATTEPEDIVQSVLKSFFRGVQSGSYDAPPGETLWNLLAVIAVNKLRGHAAYQSAQRRSVGRSVAIDAAEGEALLDDSSLEFLRLCVQETLGQLRPLDREVVSLRIKQHTVAEISEITGRTRRTVERILHNSRRQLAGLLLDQQ
jgi:RNA polymerase sigma-70 factor (ECF subfamily)